jgi:phosphoenolpyruvate carboxylase
MNDIFVKVSGLDVDSKSNDEKIKYLLESDDFKS